MEAADAGVKLIVCITEGIPVMDAVVAHQFIRMKGANLVGPNCPGLISPDLSMVGIMPTNIFKKGHTGIISRSGTLTYEVVQNLTSAGIGQSTAIGVGGDPVVGLYFEDMLQLFQDDPDTDSIVIIGEIGGDAEERAAQFIKEKVTKPVVAFIDGREAPPGKQMGHAGAIITTGSGTAAEKIAAFKAALHHRQFFSRLYLWPDSLLGIRLFRVLYAGFQVQSRRLPSAIPRAPKCNPAGSHLAYGMSNQYLRCHQT